MGCGISKLDLKETGQGYQIRSLRRRSDDETDSLTSRNRKSVSSMPSEGGVGFLKRVIGSNERERGVERELEASSDHGRKSNVSSYSFCFKQPQVEIMEKESSKENKSQNKYHQDANNDDLHQEYIRPSDAEECAASILCSPGSPSFRVYCVNDFMAAPYEDNGDEDLEENKSNKGSDKGSETPRAKRGRKGRGFRSAMHMGGSSRGLRGVLQRGGSAGMKNILSSTSCRNHTSSPSRDSTTKLIAKAV
ncbi:hypothetical protein GH714_029783 [Hevea brasiliensis]|uniref:Uncharacterized protein n=1 Tax=Hevea brasiliensis TaxID=3981 RepID=A0A6A6LK48_HEVBR|nr:hypothetical protein GH714_029783 [Hevea brasiliensis]